MKDFKKDYYKILEVHPKATADEIKLAYRKQAKKYHPDLHPNHIDYVDLIQEVNEAYEVLGDKDERFAYDTYRSNKKDNEKVNTQKPKKNRTYTKKTTVNTEERIYVKGTIFIKYFGKQDERTADNILKQIDYKITVTQIDALIGFTVKQQPTSEFIQVFASNRPIHLNIKQPISCTFQIENGGVENYKLEIRDLTIPNPEIINVTKHEGETYGTITGTFYGYVMELRTEELTVEECYGETGRAEEKYEKFTRYYRKEYYHTDCTTYWGNWVAIKPSYNTGRTSTKCSNTYASGAHTPGGTRVQANKAYGCFGTFGSVVLTILGGLLFIALIPSLAFLVPFFLIALLLNFIPVSLWNWIARIAFVIFGLVFLLAIAGTIISNRNKRNKRTELKPKPKIKKPKYTPIVESDPKVKLIDTLISRRLEWDDYDGKNYEGEYSIKKSVFDLAHSFKENLNISIDNENNYDQMVFALKENDKEKLGNVYVMFDSIRLANRPNAMRFAEIIVSAIQTIPYTIVLPKSCNAAFYQDDFTSKYLASPDARCDGFQKYGINSPLEFMANMNGDCDTRTLLLYTILSHYNYDVALLSSEHYRHSMLGINLPYQGSAFEYNDQRYIFWETTAQNIKPGILPNEMSDINYWRISLKSK